MFSLELKIEATLCQEVINDFLSDINTSGTEFSLNRVINQNVISGLFVILSRYGNAQQEH